MTRRRADFGTYPTHPLMAADERDQTENLKSLREISPTRRSARGSTCPCPESREVATWSAPGHTSRTLGHVRQHRSAGLGPVGRVALRVGHDSKYARSDASRGDRAIGISRGSDHGKPSDVFGALASALSLFEVEEGP